MAQGPTAGELGSEVIVFRTDQKGRPPAERAAWEAARTEPAKSR